MIVVCQQMILFHSRSRPIRHIDGIPSDTGRLLSNFANIPVSWQGNVYPTVEHAFQGAKYKLASDNPSIEIEFRIGGSIGDDPADAKRNGSKTGMKKRNTVLDIQKWNNISDDIMTELIIEKSKNPIIRQILQVIRKKNIYLYHFSRSDMKWGCHLDKDGNIKKGENRLGQIYMNISIE